MSGKPLPESVIRERLRTGATIRALRDARGIKPDDFADMCGRSRPFMANIEAGRKGLPEALIPVVAKILDVPEIVLVRLADALAEAA